MYIFVTKQHNSWLCEHDGGSFVFKHSGDSLSALLEAAGMLEVEVPSWEVETTDSSAKWESQDDCRGGLIYALCIVALFWVIISIIIWSLI